MSSLEKQPLKSRAVRIFTREDLATHSNTSSCWISRNGKVYDVTGFLQDHPGGEDLILDHAGKDVGEIMKNPDEHDHSDSAYEMLEEYCIGRLGSEATIVDEDWEATEDFHPDDTDTAADFEKCQFLDLRRPLLRQVWESNWSKSFYLQQIHQPRHVPGSARMFGPDFLEMFTLTKWFVVPTIWLPIAGFLFVRSRPLFNPFSLGDWSLATSPFTLLVIISKLAIQQPKDISIRLLLLPPGLYLCTYAVTFRDYALGGPQYNPWNYGVGLTSFALAMKMVHMSFTRTVPDRIVQFPSIPRKGPITVGEGCRTNGGDFSTAEGLKTEPLKGTLQDIIAYIFDPRCLRYDYKMAKTFRAIETRNTSNRVSFIISTVCRFILHLCLFDLFQTILQILPLPGLGTPKGGSIYNNTFPSPVRYIVSTTAVLSTGAAVYAGLEIGHNIVTLIGVGLLQLDPADHPPIFSKPWVSTSLRDLWSRRWHSVFRNYFAVLGYAVGHRIMGE
ncbi:fatty acid alpha-hydroxylase, partial [Tulasnella sp. 417]